MFNKYVKKLESEYAYINEFTNNLLGDIKSLVYGKDEMNSAYESLPQIKAQTLEQHNNEFDIRNVGFSTRESDYTNISNIQRCSTSRPVHLSAAFNCTMAERHNRLCLILAQIHLCIINGVVMQDDTLSHEVKNACIEVLVDQNYENLLGVFKNVYNLKEWGHFSVILVILNDAKQLPHSVKLFLIQILNENLMPNEVKRDFMWIFGTCMVKPFLALQQNQIQFRSIPQHLSSDTQQKIKYCQEYVNDFNLDAAIKVDSIDINIPDQQSLTQFQSLLLLRNNQHRMQCQIAGKESQILIQAAFKVLLSQNHTQEFESLYLLYNNAASLMLPWFITIKQSEQDIQKVVADVVNKAAIIVKVGGYQVNALIDQTITAETIQEKSEESYLASVYRLTGLLLLNRISVSLDQIYWIQTCLQQSQLNHYTDGLNFLKKQITEVFVNKIVAGLFIQCQEAEAEDDLKFSFLYTLQWKFQSLDFEYLQSSNIVSILIQKVLQLNQSKGGIGKGLMLTLQDIFVSMIVNYQFASSLLMTTVIRLFDALKSESFYIESQVADIEDDDMIDLEIDSWKSQAAKSQSKNSQNDNQVLTLIIDCLKLLTSCATQNQQIYKIAIGANSLDFIMSILKVLSQQNITTQYKMLLIIEDLHLNLTYEDKAFVFDKLFDKASFDNDTVIILQTLKRIADPEIFKMLWKNFNSFEHEKQQMILIISGATLPFKPIIGTLVNKKHLVFINKCQVFDRIQNQIVLINNADYQRLKILPFEDNTCCVINQEHLQQLYEILEKDDDEIVALVLDILRNLQIDNQTEKWLLNKITKMINVRSRQYRDILNIEDEIDYKHDNLWDKVKLLNVSPIEFAYLYGDDKIKQDWMQLQQQIMSIEFPTQDKHAMNLIQKQIDLSQSIINNIQETQNENDILDCEPLQFKPLFQGDYTEIINHEYNYNYRDRYYEKQSRIPLTTIVWMRVCYIIIDQVSPSRLTDEVVWNLHSYYMIKKFVNRMLGLSKQSSTSKWLAIIQSVPVQFQQLFIKRVLRKIYLQATYDPRDKNVQQRYVVFSLPALQIIHKLLMSTVKNYELISDFVETIMRQLSNVKFSSKHLNQFDHLLQEVHMKSLKIIEQLTNSNDPKIYQILASNTLISKFISQSNQKFRFIKQFSLVARLIEVQLYKSYLKFEQQGPEPPVHCINRVNQLLQFESILQNPMLITFYIQNSQNSNIWSHPYNIITKDQFGTWNQINVNPIASAFTTTITLRGINGFGCGLIAASTEPNFNNKTQYKMIQTKGSQFEIKFELQSPTIYIMFPVSIPYILRFKNNQLIQTTLIQNLSDQQDLQLYSFKVDKKTISFVVSNDKLYLFTDGKGQEECTEITGNDSKVNLIEQHDDQFVFYTQNYVYFYPAKKLKVKQNYYVDENFRKNIFKVVNIESSQIFGLTDKGKNIVITFQGKFDQAKSKTTIKIKEEGKQFSLTITAKQTINNGIVKLKAAQIYLKTNADGQHQENKFIIQQCNVKQGFQAIKCTSKQIITAYGNKIEITNLAGDIQHQYQFDQVQIINEIYSLHQQQLVFYSALDLEGKHCLYLQDKLLIQNKFQIIRTNLYCCFAIDQQGEIWFIFLDQGIGQSSNYMKQANTQAINIWIKQPNILVALVQLKFTSKQELQLMMFPPVGNKSGDLNELLFLDNQSLKDKMKYSSQFEFHLDDDEVIFLVEKPSNITEIHYKVNGQPIDTYSNDELAQCVNFVDNELKIILNNDVDFKVWSSQCKIDTFINYQNLQGNRADLVRYVVAMNQFLIDFKEITIALSNANKLPASFQTLLQQFATNNVLFSINDFRLYGTKGTKHPIVRVNIHRLNSQESLFEQLFRATFVESTKIYSNSVIKHESSFRPFKVKLIGERSYDQGGPFKELLEDCCKEILAKYFNPTANCLYFDQDGYEPIYKEWQQEELLRLNYIGKMIGWSLQQFNLSLSLDLNILFWKKLLALPFQLQDLQYIDLYRYQMLESIIKGDYRCNFVADLGSGIEEELCEGGSTIEVTQQNCAEFINLYLQKYEQQHNEAYMAIIEGVKQVCPKSLLSHLTPKFANQIAFSNSRITAEMFISHISTDGLDSSDLTLIMFKELIKQFTDNERSLLLKFITGSTRLTPDSELRIETYEAHSDQNNDDLFPIAHTCGDQLDLPAYSNIEIMMQKVRQAMTICGEIDFDHQINSVHDEDTSDDDDYYSSDQSNDENSDQKSDSYYTDVNESDDNIDINKSQSSSQSSEDSEYIPEHVANNSDDGDWEDY